MPTRSSTESAAGPSRAKELALSLLAGVVLGAAWFALFFAVCWEDSQIQPFVYAAF